MEKVKRTTTGSKGESERRTLGEKGGRRKHKDRQTMRERP